VTQRDHRHRFGFARTRHMLCSGSRTEIVSSPSTSSTRCRDLAGEAEHRPAPLLPGLARHPPSCSISTPSISRLRRDAVENGKRLYSARVGWRERRSAGRPSPCRFRRCRASSSPSMSNLDDARDRAGDPGVDARDLVPWSRRELGPVRVRPSPMTWKLVRDEPVADDRSRCRPPPCFPAGPCGG